MNELQEFEKETPIYLCSVIWSYPFLFIVFCLFGFFVDYFFRVSFLYLGGGWVGFYLDLTHQRPRRKDFSPGL